MSNWVNQGWNDEPRQVFCEFNFVSVEFEVCITMTELRFYLKREFNSESGGFVDREII